MQLGSMRVIDPMIQRQATQNQLNEGGKEKIEKDKQREKSVDQ